MCLPLLMINVEIFMSLSGQNLVFYSFKTFKNKSSCITHPWFTFHASLAASVLANLHGLSVSPGQLCVHCKILPDRIFYGAAFLFYQWPFSEQSFYNLYFISKAICGLPQDTHGARECVLVSPPAKSVMVL